MMNSPLTKNDLTSINAHLRKLLDLRQEVSKAESCGVDCSPLTTMIDQHHQILTTMKQTYFPGQP